jgi:hypothetical protein
VTLPSNAQASLAMLCAVCLWSSATPTTKLAVQEIAVGEFVAVAAYADLGPGYAYAASSVGGRWSWACSSPVS